MDVSFHEIGNGVVLRPQGRLDAEGANSLQAVLDAVFQTSAARIIIDLAGVDFLASAGVRVLLAAYKRMQAADRLLELMRPAPLVRKVLQLVGLDELMPTGALHILDVLKRRSPHNHQALQNARQFLQELFDTLGIDPQRAACALDDVFQICQTAETAAQIELELRGALIDMDLAGHLRATEEDRAAAVYDKMAPYGGPGTLLDMNGDAKVDDPTRLPFRLYDGRGIDAPDRAFDYAVLVNVLHHCDDPLCALREVRRVTRRRILVTESVHLSEAHRRFNVFFDWFYNRVLRDDGRMACQFNSPEGWEHLFQQEGLVVAASVDIGLDHATVPEYHWLYVLDLPDPA